MNPADPGILTRRKMLQLTGLTALGAMVDMPAWAECPGVPHAEGALPSRPNILIVLVDQQRAPRDWPEGWAAENIPSFGRLAANGITFNRAYCNACMCSPSRATLFTGVYTHTHRVTDTLSESTTLFEQQLEPDYQNIARMLKSAGYSVHYRGKWHLTKPDASAPNYPKPTVEDVQAYGFDTWETPDSGEDTKPENFGILFDEGYATGAINQIQNMPAGKPWALIVSFVNPHDVLAYPTTYEMQPEFADIHGLDVGIDLPATIDEDLVAGGKPRAHALIRAVMAAGLGPLPTDAAKRTYVNFYAYLQSLVDVQINRVLDAVLCDPELKRDTVIIRCADHGELGLAHGGMRQKNFNMYEQAVNVPLQVSNPVLFPEPVESDALVSLVDVLPTIASLVGLGRPAGYDLRGTDLTPLFTNPDGEVQDSILFTYDDEHAGSLTISPIVPPPNHILAIFEKRWKFARYYDPAGVEDDEYELYDLEADPEELHNLARHADTIPTIGLKVEEMKQKLNKAVAQKIGPGTDHLIMY